MSGPNLSIFSQKRSSIGRGLRLLCIYAVTSLFSGASQASVSLPYTFSSGTLIQSSQLNANFGALRDEVNTHENLTNPHQTALSDVLIVNNSCGANPIDFNDNQALNLILEALLVDPTPAHAGRIFTVGGSPKIDTGSGILTILTAGTGGGDFTVGTIDTATASANGMAITGTKIYAQSASTSNPGLVNNSTQSMSGNKTFTGTLGVSGAVSATGSITSASTVAGTNLTSSGHASLDALKSGDTFTGAVTGTSAYFTSIYDPNMTASRVVTNDSTGALSTSTTTLAEIDFVHGLTSALQTQLNLLAPKASPTFTGSITTPISTNHAVVTNGSNQLTAGGATATEVGYLSGVTSAIQTQINSIAGSATSIGAVSGTSTAKGLDLTGNVLTAHYADGTNPGLLSATTQTIAGNKTFTGTTAFPNSSSIDSSGDFTTNGYVSLASAASFLVTNGYGISLSDNTADETITYGLNAGRSHTIQHIWYDGTTNQVMTLSGLGALLITSLSTTSETVTGPGTALTVNNNAAVNGNLGVVGAISITGNLNTLGTFAASGTATVAHIDATSETLTGTGTAFTVNNNAAVNGNLQVLGTIGVTGTLTGAHIDATSETITGPNVAFTVNNNAAFNNNITVGGTLAVTGNLTTYGTTQLNGGTNVGGGDAINFFGSSSGSITVAATATGGTLNIIGPMQATALSGPLTGTVTGTASGNTTYTANNHGVVLSGSGNAMTVIAPTSSTTKVLTSGGASADPSWSSILDAMLPASMATKTFTGVTTFPGTSSWDGSGNITVGGSTQLNGGTNVGAGQAINLYGASSGISTISATSTGGTFNISGGMQAPSGTFTAAGIASTPGLLISGAPFTGGSASTTQPQVYVNASTGGLGSWSTSGTMLGVNAISGFSGNLMDLQNNGSASLFNVSNLGQLTQTTYGNNSQILFQRASGTAATPTAVAAANTVGGIFFTSYNGSAFGASNAAITVKTLNTQTTGDNSAHLIFRTAPSGSNSTSVERMRVAASGDVLINTTTDDAVHILQVNGAMAVTGALSASTTVLLTGLSTGTNADFLCLKADGTVLLQTTACTISQRALKENFVEITGESALSEILALHPLQFNLKATVPPNPDVANAMHTQVGLIAEEVEAVDPRLAVYKEDGITPKSYRQEAVIAVLIKAIQEQNAQIVSLQTAITKLQKRE